MKIFRFLGLLALVVIVVMCLLYLLGWRRQVPTVTLVDVNANSIAPVLKVGQVLKWEGAKDGPGFNIQFLYGGGPCGTEPILSRDEGGIQVATCKVATLPPNGKRFIYGIGKGNQKPDILLGVRACDGCTFFSGDGSGDTNNTPARKGTSFGAFNNVTIGCNTPPDPAGVAVVPSTIHADSLSHVDFGPAPNVDSFTLDFGSANVSCADGGGSNYQCTLPTTASSYPYTVKAVPESGTSCGSGTGQGTVLVP